MIIVNSVFFWMSLIITLIATIFIVLAVIKHKERRFKRDDFILIIGGLITSTLQALGIIFSLKQSEPNDVLSKYGVSVIAIVIFVIYFIYYCYIIIHWIKYWKE